MQPSMTVTFASRISVQDVEEGHSLAPRFPMDGLMPCVTTDAGDDAVLMIGWMNAEALRLTIALLHKSDDGRGSPFPRTESSHSFGDGYAERCEGVQESDTDLGLGNLTVEIPSCQTLAQQFDTMHLGLDAAPVIKTAPSSPDSSTEAFRRAKRLVSHNRPRAIGLP